MSAKEREEPKAAGKLQACVPGTRWHVDGTPAGSAGAWAVAGVSWEMWGKVVVGCQVPESPAVSSTVGLGGKASERMGLEGSLMGMMAGKWAKESHFWGDPG